MPKQINVRVPDIVYNRLAAYMTEQATSQKQAIVDAINSLHTKDEVSLLRQELDALKVKVEMLVERNKVG